MIENNFQLIQDTGLISKHYNRAFRRVVLFKISDDLFEFDFDYRYGAGENDQWVYLRRWTNAGFKNVWAENIYRQAAVFSDDYKENIPLRSIKEIIDKIFMQYTAIAGACIS